MGLKEQVVKDIIRECIEPLLELKKGFEKQENRVDEITEDLPTEKYPSVNAVMNFVKNKLTDFSNNLSTVYLKLLDFDVYKKDVKTSFENLEKGVADTYATKTVVDDLKTNTEVTRTATGNAITIESSQAPLQNLKLFGKTEQKTTTGKNLLEVKSVGPTIGGIVYTVNDDKSISISGTPTDTTSWKNLTVNSAFYLPNGRYKLTCSGYKNLKKLYPILYWKNTDGTHNGLATLQNGDTVKFEVTDGKNTVNCTIACSPDYTPQGERLYISIFPESVTDLSYEPYTGGIPSPNPAYPQKLDSIGDTGSFKFGVYGKNLFDGLLEQKTTVNENTSVSRIRSKTLIPVIAGNKYTITKHGDNSNAFRFAINTNPTYIKGYPLDARLTTICGNSQNWQNGNYYSFVATQNGVMALLFREDPDSTSITIDKMKKIKFQVELGDSTPYEPYKEKQTLTIPYALRSVSDIKDEVDFMRGVYCGKIFNKSLTDFHLSQHIYTSENYLVATILDTGYALKSVCLSTHFEMISDEMLGKSTGVYIYVSSTNKTAIHISIPKTIASDTTALKQWLIDNDVKFYYPLATPIKTPLTETELNDYRHLMTNKGNNTIFSEAEAEVDYYINKPNAQAIGNIHSQLNKDYFKLQQAIIEIGGN